MSQSVVDLLEAVDVEHEHRTLDSAHLRLLGCCDRVAVFGEHQAVGQAGQRVVQRLVPDRALGPTARGRGSQDVRDSLDEVHVLFGELAWAPAPDTEHTGGGVLALDRHLDHAHGL